MAKMSDVKFVLYGVQFNHSFKLLDNWGAIADDILYKSECFGCQFFSNISSEYTTERGLSNNKTGDFLTLSSNQLVFKYHVLKDKNFQNEYDYFGKRVKYLVETILTKYNLVVRRSGLVIGCKLDEKEIANFASRFFKEEIQGITDFRFAQNEPTASGQLWHGVDDYINKIYTVGTIEDEEKYKGITYDFQLHHKPLLADARKITPIFLKSALESFKKDLVFKE